MAPFAPVEAVCAGLTGDALAGGTQSVQIVEVVVAVIVETVSVVIVVLPWVCVTGQVVVVVYTITVVTTSCVDAGELPWLVGTAGEFPPVALGRGVGFAVHFVQTVITLVTKTVDVVRPVVTLWLPLAEMVDVNGQTVV